MLISLQVVILLIFFLSDKTILNSADNLDKNDELWRVAKKEFARRTREYLRKNPMSDELRSFIEELKQSKRRKRQDHRNMYVIKDGDIVPLEKFEESLNTQSNLGDNFTVVPLVIPIPLENTVTLKDRTTTQEEGLFAGYGSSVRPILGRGQALTNVKEKKEGQAGSSDDRNSKTEETVVDNLIDDKLKSTSDAMELNKVLEDVQHLISSQKKGKFSSKDGALCNISGYWDSETGGVTFHIKKNDGGADIKMQPREPPSDDGFIPLEKWNVTVRIPFQQSTQVIVILTSNKGRKVAIFLGECRICDGSETITGDWLVGRTSSGCKDQKAAHSFLADVFRKNNIETLREAHMKKISNLTTSTTMNSSP